MKVRIRVLIWHEPNKGSRNLTQNFRNVERFTQLDIWVEIRNSTSKNTVVELFSYQQTIFLCWRTICNFRPRGRDPIQPVLSFGTASFLATTMFVSYVINLSYAKKQKFRTLNVLRKFQLDKFIHILAKRFIQTFWREEKLSTEHPRYMPLMAYCNGKSYKFQIPEAQRGFEH